LQSLWHWDLETYRAIHVGLHRDWLDPFFWVISTSGLGWVQVIVALLVPLIFAGKWVIDREPDGPGLVRLTLKAAWKRWSNPAYLVAPLLAVILISGLFFTGIVKNLINRERPSHLWFAHPQEDVTSRSYPSGHTTTAFAIAFILLFVTWGTPKRWVGWLVVLWAVLVGFSRVYRGVHWPSDVLGGLFSGLIAASIVYLFMRRAAAKAEGSGEAVE